MDVEFPLYYNICSQSVAHSYMSPLYSEFMELEPNAIMANIER